MEYLKQVLRDSLSNIDIVDSRVVTHVYSVSVSARLRKKIA